MTRQNTQRLTLCILFMLFLTLTACGGRMYHTKVENGVESVYHKDEKKSLLTDLCVCAHADHRIKQYQQCTKNRKTDPSSGNRAARCRPDSSRDKTKPDVEIFPKVYFKEAVGYDKKSKKLVPMYIFYFEFTIRSNYLPEDNDTFEEHGNWIYNQKIVADGTGRIRKVIKQMIGPSIPAERHKYLYYGANKLLGEVFEGKISR